MARIRNHDVLGLGQLCRHHLAGAKKSLVVFADDHNRGHRQIRKIINHRGRQTGNSAAKPRNAWNILRNDRARGRLGRRFCGLLPKPMAAVARLELASITRDTGQWTQLALLAALSGLYLYNLKLIPGDQRIVGPLLALLNVGVAGLVLSAVALRLGLPSVSRDGPSRWLPETSPLGAFKRLLAKSLVVGAPLVLLGGGLTSAAALLVPAPLDLKSHAVMAVLLMGPTLAAIAVGVGARFPRYDADDASQATIGSGGLLGFALMLLYTGVMTVLSARPVFSWYLARVGLHTGPSTLFLASLALQVGLSLLLAAGALSWGARFLERHR